MCKAMQVPWSSSSFILNPHLQSDGPFSCARVEPAIVSSEPWRLSSGLAHGFGWLPICNAPAEFHPEAWGGCTFISRLHAHEKYPTHRLQFSHASDTLLRLCFFSTCNTRCIYSDRSLRLSFSRPKRAWVNKPSYQQPPSQPQARPNLRGESRRADPDHTVREHRSERQSPWAPQYPRPWPRSSDPRRCDC